MNRAWLGVLLVLLALLSGSLFFVRSYHDLYWSNPAVFILLPVIGVASAPAGGFLLGRNLGMRQQGSADVLRSLSIAVGIPVALVGAVLGVMAVGLALGVSNTGYWGQPPYDYNYNGDYMIMGFQIMAFQAAIAPDIIGGFLIGFGLQMKAQDG